MSAFGDSFRPSSIIAAERVDRGLRWLKEYGPFLGLDHTRIDVNTLFVSDPRHCPLGQANSTGWYGVVNQLMSGQSPAVSTLGMTVSDWITECGFDVAPWDPADMYAQLNDAWRRALIADLRQR